jgi:hypothetical protein
VTDETAETATAEATTAAASLDALDGIDEPRLVDTHAQQPTGVFLHDVGGEYM